LVTRWRIENGVLHIETGLLRRRSLRYPLAQVQAIDVVQTGFARAFGLAELRFRMAGGADRGGGRLQGLKEAEAQQVRAQLLAVVRRIGDQDQADDTVASAAVDAPEARFDPGDSVRVLFTVPTGRLIGSIVLSLLGFVVTAIVVAAVVVVSIAPAAAGALLSSAAAIVLGFGTGLYRRINGEYRQTVAIAADGFRLSSGLIEKSNETIPPGRVQGIRLVEPVLWRPFGWCRLEVEVAGKRVREENSSQGRERRALLPVGSDVDVQVLLEQLVPYAPALDHRPPGRARWKAPLSYRNLAWGLNEHCAVTRSGRLRRTTHWVQLEKVQSLRRVQGPIQRRLDLGNLHLDTAGRSIHALIRDDDFSVVSAHIGALPPQCRTARERARRERAAGIHGQRSPEASAGQA
jgi:putative membrane protein